MNTTDNSQEISTKTAQQWGISSRTIVYQDRKNHFIIEKKRKTRIIVQDGKKIVDIANKIRYQIPEAKITLIVSGPVCSKTKNLLADAAIQIVYDKNT